MRFGAKHQRWKAGNEDSMEGNIKHLWRLTRKE
jgi:hypothetical protein